MRECDIKSKVPTQNIFQLPGFLSADGVFLFQGRLYYVRVSAYNMKGWGPAAPSCPPSAAPSSEFALTHTDAIQMAAPLAQPYRL